MCNGPYNRHYATATGAGAAPSASYQYPASASHGAGMQQRNMHGGYAHNSNPTGQQEVRKRAPTKKEHTNSLGVRALNKEVLVWAGFFTASLFVYFALSGGDFSFLLTYGGLARAFGFALLNLKIFGSGGRDRKKAATTGISAATLQLYCVVFFFRLASVTFHEGYLPYDKSGDWLYHAVEGTALLLSSLALWAVTSNNSNGSINDDDDDANALCFAIPVLAMAILAHPNLNASFVSDTAWTYAMYLESVALLPQLALFRSQSSKEPKSKPSTTTVIIEPLTAHFVFALGFGRIMEFSFWMFSHGELTSATGSMVPGYLAIFSQAGQLLVMAEFFYYYCHAMKNNAPMVLPSVNGDVASMV